MTSVGRTSGGAPAHHSFGGQEQTAPRQAQRAASVPPPGLALGRCAAAAPERSARRARSAPPVLQGAAPPLASALTFAELVGEAQARRMDEEWGAVHGARVKRGRPQVHDWEAGLNPDRVAIPSGNPANARLDELLDLEAVKQGTPVLWSIGPGETLLLGPHTELEGLDPDTGKSRRLGHPSLLPGTLKNAETGEWWGKEARISGELGWDVVKDRFYIVNQSGRYSRHEGMGRAQMENVARSFAQCGLAVEIRVLGEAG